jgi:hypothetical protein
LRKGSLLFYKIQKDKEVPILTLISISEYSCTIKLKEKMEEKKERERDESSKNK